MINLLNRTFLAALIFTLFWGLSLPERTQAQSRSMDITLAGYKLEPSVPTSATGLLTLTVENDTLTVEGSFSDLMAPYMSSGIYFVQGERAVNQLLRFKTVLNEDHTGGKLRAEDNQFRLSDALKELLNNGELSIRIGSNQHKQGEIGAMIPGRG